MNYTIMYLVSMSNKQELTLDKSGNEFSVALIKKESFECGHKEFKELDEAIECFNKGATIIAKGLYSFEDRCKILFG